MDKVFIEITNCDACPYGDHSGSFTPGGAKPICGHSDASDKATENKEINFLVEDLIVGDKIKAGKHHWIHRVIKDNEIPTWCPLR